MVTNTGVLYFLAEEGRSTGEGSKTVVGLVTE